MGWPLGTFVGILALWAVSIRGFLVLWAFLAAAHVGQGQVCEMG